MSNLRLIDETSVTSAVNTIQITDVFSADFDVYCIEAVGISSETSQDNNSADIRLINSNGSIQSGSSIYDSEMIYARGFDQNYLEIGGYNRDDFALLYYDTSANNAFGNFTMWIFNPFNSDSYTFQVQQSIGTSRRPTNSINSMWHKGIGVLRELSSITGFCLIQRDSNNVATGTFRTYGLRVDS